MSGGAEALGATGRLARLGRLDAVAAYAWVAWVILGEDTLVFRVAVQLEWVQLANRLALVSPKQFALVGKPSLGRAWVAGLWLFGQEP